MRRTLLATAMLMFVLPAHAGEIWSRLWHNADQRGEALLQRGDASAAAEAYADPRRKAYARLKAGDYQGAAHDLAGLHDSDADYNRGNALAHAGSLQAALDAYDAALKSNPDNQDARQNRELVANALKQQAQQQQDSGGNKAQDEQKGQQGKDSAGQGSQGQHSAQDQAGQQDKNGQQGKSAEAGSKPGQGQESAARSQPAQHNQAQQQAAAGQASRDGNSQEGHTQDGKRQDGKQTAAKDDAGQARRDAAASLAKATADGKDSAGLAGAADSTPGSEQQLAQEQWLRSIPDDPGGLLRRKFMIEHMMRQQRAQP